MNFVSCADLARDVLELVPFCLEHDVSAVCGAPRSGMLPATMLATALHLPLVMGREHGFGRRVRVRPRPANGPVLLIEDSVNSGSGLEEAAAQARDHFGLAPLTAAVYVAPGRGDLVDAFVRELPQPRLFEWNLFGSERTPRIMFDLDGVFCPDPPVYDDDGPLYAKWIADAPPRRISVWPVGWIVTNRLERWSAVTLAWLARHRIEIRNALRMQPYATAAERRAKTTPAAFKARCYAEAPDAELFVESNDHQAREIHGLTRRPVLSIETMRCYR